MKTQVSQAEFREYARNPKAFREDLLVQAGGETVEFRDCMYDFQRDRFADIDPDLLAIAEGTKPKHGRHWWEATKGASKDSDLAVCIIWLLMFSRRLLDMQIGAADKAQADELRKAAKTCLALNPWIRDTVDIQNWRMVNVRTESAAAILSADNTGAHGSRPDVTIVNELTHIPDGKREFAETMLDNASKIPYGLVVVATNAGILDSWQYNWREMARTVGRWVFHKFDQPAPWLSDEEMRESRIRNSKSRYNRLWGGQWVSSAGDALEEEDVDAAFANNVSQMGQWDPDYTFVGGLDIGVKKDYCAFVSLAKHISGRYRVARCHVWKPMVSPSGETLHKVDLEQVERAILADHNSYQFEEIAADPNQADYLVSRLEKQGVPIIERPQSAKTLVEQCLCVLEQFNSHNIDCYAHKALEYDLRHLKVEEKSYGMRLISERGPHGHGDLASALSIALAIAMDVEGGADVAQQLDPSDMLLRHWPLSHGRVMCEMMDGRTFALSEQEFEDLYGDQLEVIAQTEEIFRI